MAASTDSAGVPTFSIVVPCHNSRAWLRPCLDSVLGQSFTDFEIIGVDDASPDGCGRILDEYAAADPRVRVLHLPENVGLGGPERRAQGVPRRLRALPGRRRPLPARLAGGDRRPDRGDR